MDKLVILDNGHGISTIGKRSPNGLFREYKWCRELVSILTERLKKLGYEVYQCCPENDDTPLSERIKRVNRMALVYEEHSPILISIHNNAAGSDNKWHDARGWSAYTSKGKTESDNLVSCLYKAAEVYLKEYKNTFPFGSKRYIRGNESGLEENFYMVKKSICPAVLIENMFQDNATDVDYLMSDKGKEEICNVIIAGIEMYYTKSSIVPAIKVE